MEDFNQPSPERTKLLKRLDEQIGAVAPHFWAACQICDISALEKFLDHEYIYVQGIADQVSQTVRHCKSNSPAPLHQYKLIRTL
jgi:hypothetical protein